MSRLRSIFTLLILSAPVSSAQITGGGTGSVTGLLSQLLGLNFSEPYVAIGFTATFGLMWVSVYIIFKVGIKRFDSGYGSGRDSPLSDALGLDDENSRNILAVLTLLITLSMLGTGAFYGLIRGWQSMVLLMFTFMLLAGLIFVLLGGTGGIIGGTAYATGKATKAVTRNLEEAKEDVEELKGEEDSLDDLEDEIEDEEKDARRREEKDGSTGEGSGSSSDSRSGRGTSGDSEGSSGDRDSSGTGGGGSKDSGRTEAEVKDIVKKLEKAFQILEDIEKKLSDDLESESESIESHTQKLKELRKILESGETPYRELRELIEELENKGIDSSSSKDDVESALDGKDISNIIDRSGLQDYISELEDLERDLRELNAEIVLLREIEELLKKLQEEVGSAEEEEKILEKLISDLGDSEIKRKLIEELKEDRGELEAIERRFKELKEFSDKIRTFFNFLEKMQDELGDLENLIHELEKMKEISRKLENFYTSHSEVDVLSFSPEDSNYITEGTKFSLPGSQETALIDMNLQMIPNNDDGTEEMFEEPYESLLRDLAEPLSSEFKRKGRRGNDDRSVQGLIMTVFRIIEDMKNLPGNVDRDVKLSSQISGGRKYNSELINSIYLGIFLQNISDVYSMMMQYDERDEDGRALTKVSINNYSKNLNVYLTSYRTEHGTEPFVMLDDSDGLYGFLIRSGNLIENIDEDMISGVYLIE